MEKVKFELSNEKIQFLKKHYPKNDLIQKILSTEKKGEFEVDEDSYIDFMDYLDDDSIKILWQTNKYWRNSLKDELLRKGLAKLNE